MTESDLPGPDWVPELPLDVRFRRQRGILLVARQDDSVELDEVSAEIFNRIDGETSVADIAAAISTDFEVDQETALTDVREFLVQLTELNILVRNW